MPRWSPRQYGRYDDIYLGNYALLQVRDVLARLPDVGDISIFGARDYSMRIWLDPERIAARDLTASDVVRAIREQNVQVAAGSLGQPPAPGGSDLQYTVRTMGRPPWSCWLWWYSCRTGGPPSSRSSLCRCP